MEQRSSGESDADVCGADYREGIAAYQAAIALVTAHRGGDLATEIGLIEAVLERVGPVLMMATFTALVSQVLDRLDQPTVSGGGDGYLCQLGQHTALVGLAHDRAARPRN